MPQPTINLGAKVRDRITGLIGVVTSRTEWLYGCVRCGVQPDSLDKDGKYRDAIVLDEPQLEVINPSKPKEPPQKGGGRGDEDSVSKGKP